LLEIVASKRAASPKEITAGSKLMKNEEVSPRTSVTPNPSSVDPALVGLVEALTDTHEAQKAAGIADMLLIFLSAAGTILGGMAAATLYLFMTASHAYTGPWKFQLLASVFAGGLLGCFGVMGILNAKGLIAWERRARSS
jgi:hypothetical protein